jgi:hypothetical protein
VKFRFSNLFLRWSSSKPDTFKFSWIVHGQLGIGPMPRTINEWQILETAGFRSRFSCCYLEEESDVAQPTIQWRESRVALPDHRCQELLTKEVLVRAIGSVLELIHEEPPLYLHCWAGRERSALLAVAAVSVLRGLPLMEALLWVNRAHPQANPLYEHLTILEQVLKEEA